MMQALLNGFYRSRWVIAFILICSSIYERAMQKREEQFIRLKEQLAVLNREKKSILHEQTNLQLQVNSQSDPAWIELTLMKGLGVSPENKTKVFFYREEEKLRSAIP